MTKHFFVTTPIYYANAEPHIGHTYTTVVVDTLVRWHRARGQTTWAVSGTDEHGEKMVEAAAQRGETPAAFTERVSAVHQRTWTELDLAVDRFVRTTDADHVRNVQAVLQRAYDAGWIEMREYEGLYCVGCERFVTERDLEGGLCRDHEIPPEPRRETNYFFAMSRLFDWLREHIQADPSFIQPERYRNEALAMLRDESGLGDLSISRPKSRLAWGIELPFDRDHVCYVWFDALLSYLTGAGFDGAKRWEEQPPAFRARWANAHHLIGKDILKPHAIFWPTMLRAMGFPPYRSLHVHGYWKVDDRKVSKSLGNMISPLAMRERYGFEAFRWFLLREMSFGLDASFTEEALVERANADLANNVGNLVSRTLNLVEKLCGGSVPEAGPADDADRAIEAGAAAARERIATAMGAVQPHLALAAIVEYASDVNRYVDARAPWKAAKDPALAPSARTTLHVACRALAALAELLGPFVPAAAAEIGRRVGAATDGSLPAGARVTKGDALFRRLEKPSAG